MTPLDPRQVVSKLRKDWPHSIAVITIVTDLYKLPAAPQFREHFLEIKERDISILIEVAKGKRISSINRKYKFKGSAVYTAVKKFTRYVNKMRAVAFKFNSDVNNISEINQSSNSPKDFVKLERGVHQCLH